MTAIKTIIYRGGDIYKETSAGLKVIEFCSRLPLRSKIEVFQTIETNIDNLTTGERCFKNVFYKYFDFSKLTFDFRFATFVLIENWIVYLIVVTLFVCLVVRHYFDVQCAM